MLRIILTVFQVFASIGIIGLVLLQRGKGADAGAGFGAGASGTVFGARGARTVLSRATAILAMLFMINSLALAYMGSREQAAEPTTILDEVGQVSEGSDVPPTSIPAPATSPPPGATAPEPASGAASEAGRDTGE